MSTPRVVVQRSALAALKAHASEVAKTSRCEALGWLVGFFREGSVYVADAVPCTKYKSQTRYGAEADPTEEAALSLRFPRAVGIVGLYHSHPFKDETEHALFHSHTDDSTLKTRSSRRDNTLSVVTDLKAATFYVYRRGKPQEITAEVVDEVRVAKLLGRYVSRLAVSCALSEPAGTLARASSLLQEEVRQRLDASLDGGAEITSEGGKRIITLPGLDEVSTSAIRLKRTAHGLGAELDLVLTPTIYTMDEDAALLDALRDEILDDAGLLLREGLGDRVEKMSASASLEAHLGTIRVMEKTPLPVKVYRPPKRGAVIRR